MGCGEAGAGGGGGSYVIPNGTSASYAIATTTTPSVNITPQAPVVPAQGPTGPTGPPGPRVSQRHAVIRFARPQASALNWREPWYAQKARTSPVTGLAI